MEKSFPPWRAVKAMESTDWRNVYVRGRISMCRVGTGPGWKSGSSLLKSRWNQRLVEADRWSPQCKRKSLYTQQKCCRTLAARALLRPRFRAVTCSVWVLCLPAAPSGYGLSVRSSSSQCAGEDTVFTQKSVVTPCLLNGGTEGLKELSCYTLEMLRYSSTVSLSASSS